MVANLKLYFADRIIMILDILLNNEIIIKPSIIIIHFFRAPVDFLFFLFYTTSMALIKEIDMLVVKVIKPKDKKEKEDEENDGRNKREKRREGDSGRKTS